MTTPDATLLAGTARVVITPPVGIHLTGFAGRAPSLGVHDDLYATALVLAGHDGERVVLVSLDVLGMYGDHVAPAIKAEVERATGIPGDRILLTCTHTHYGPVLTDHQEGGDAPIAVAYRAALPHYVSGVVSAAIAALRPVTLAAGRGHVKIGINRRELREGRIVLGQHPDGPLDSEVLVWRFDAAPTPDTPAPDAPLGWLRHAPDTVATIVSYACHPVSLGGSMRYMTADFPGIARAEVERLVGGTCLFLQGACGNINPSLMLPEWDVPLRLGRALGAEAARATLFAEPVEALPLRFNRRAAGLPALLPASLEAGERLIAQQEAERARLLSQSTPSPGRLWWVEQVLERARAGVESLRTGRPLPPVEGTYAALRLGETALVSNPTELFCEIGMEIKRASPFTHTAVVGYTDAAIGYVPTRAAYPDGGYEVERASRVGPDAADLLRDVSLDLLRSLK